ncbi:MAG TPA: MMPL family transporter [Solirubrobacterales bacterium]|nr:MMPL family transporter [Solirubrobacterales bacterium]
MSGLLHRLGGFSARNAKLVVPLWIVLTVALVLIANSVGRETNNDLTLPGTGSTEAQNLLDKKLPAQANGSVPIVIETESGTLTSGSNKQAVEDTVKSLKANENVQDAISPYSQQGAADISADGKIAYIAVALTENSGDLTEDESNSVLDSAEPARKAGLEVSAGGYLGDDLSNPSTRASEVIGVVAALIILLFAFRTFTAAPLPVTTAVVALLAGLAVVGLGGHVFNVPSIAPTLGIMLGLAVGTDYSLFIISRQMRLLDQGDEPEDAIARAVATSGSAVVFAGSTVVIALLSLYFSGIPLVRSLGYATAIVVAVAVLAAITLLPALLGLLGRRIQSLPFRLGSRGREPRHAPGWGKWADRLRRHPVIATLGGVAVLVVIALPILDMRLGAPDDGQLPEDETARQAYDALTKGFGVGTNGQLLISVDVPADKPLQPDPQEAQQAAAQEQQVEEEAAAEGGPTAKQQQQEQQLTQEEQIAETPAGDPRLVHLQQEIAKQTDVQSVSPAATDSKGTAAVFAVTPKTSPSAYATQDLVNHLRDETIPDSLQGTGMKAYVGGTTAGYIDLADKISEKLPLVIAIVVLLSILLLMLAFRTLTVPLVSALVNLLAVIASYGVLTAVFEKGWGIELIGLDGTMPIVSYVPLMMFAILFGLSMDYQVFLVSRIAERHGAGAENSAAVTAGLASTGRWIAAAATIMFAVFFSFVLNGDPIVKQFGVGLAVAVAIDAFVVLLIMPALMELLRERNWYLPHWLDRILPDLKVEGDVELRREGAPT